MLKYFISYKKFLDSNNDIDIYNSNLKIVKKKQDGSFIAEPVLYFNEYAKNIIEYCDKIEASKKGIYIMVELSEDEINNFNDLYVKSFEVLNTKKMKLVNNDIKLINYNTFINMSNKEIESSNKNSVVSVNLNDKNKERNSIDLIKDNSFYKKREELLQKSIGCDIYFYTDDKELLERYKNEITVLKEVEMDAYEIISHKIYTIDSVPQERIYDLVNSSLRILYDICDRSIPIYISELDNGNYELCKDKFNRISKKVYCITDFNIKNLIHNFSIGPLLKYINVFELDKYGYKKINIEEYLKRENILKYIKKPS